MAAAGLSLLALAGSAESLALVVAGYMVMALGLAPVFTLATDLIIGTVTPERAGTAAGMAGDKLGVRRCVGDRYPRQHCYRHLRKRNAHYDA